VCTPRQDLIKHQKAASISHECNVPDTDAATSQSPMLLDILVCYAEQTEDRKGPGGVLHQVLAMAVYTG
jgi:hypothetical protein